MKDIYKREWPAKGQQLYSMSDEPEAIHMSFIPTPGKQDPAVLMRINWEEGRVTILDVKPFKREKDAIAWYLEEKRKLESH